MSSSLDKLTAALFTLLFAALTSGSTQGSSAHAADVAGCYRIRLGPWSGPFPSGWPDVHQPPPTFRLDSVPLPAPHDQGGFRRVSPDLAVLHGLTRFPPGWKQVGRDSVHIYWSTGFSGVELRLVHVSPDTLHGVAEAFYDVIGPVEPTAPAVAWKIPCASEVR